MKNQIAMNHQYAGDPGEGRKTLAASCHKKSKNENLKSDLFEKIHENYLQKIRNF